MNAVMLADRIRSAFGVHNGSSVISAVPKRTSSVHGSTYSARDLAESDACSTGCLAPTAQNHRITVFKESARLIGHAYGLLTAQRELEQRARFGGRRTGKRAATQQIPGWRLQPFTV
jgi:hypothetical protein